MVRSASVIGAFATLRLSTAERSWLGPDPTPGRLGLLRVELLETPSPFDEVIVIFPLELGAAESSSESNCPESATLIALLVVAGAVALLTLRADCFKPLLDDDDW